MHTQQPAPTHRANQQDETVLEGHVTRIIYTAPENTMRLFEVELDDRSLRTVVQYDNLQPLKAKDQIRVFGKSIHHKRFGKQFRARDIVKRIPTTPDGVAKVLAGREFKGIGAKTAQRLADALGPDLISTLNHGDPSNLIAALIGPAKAQKLISAWAENVQGHATHALLADLGVGASLRNKIIETFPDFEAVLQENPYRIAKEIEGIGFLTADALALRAGRFQPDNPQRMAMGIQHSLDLAQREGHTGQTFNQLVEKASEVLGFTDRQVISDVLKQEIASGRVAQSPNDLLQKPIVAATEQRLAEKIVELSTSKLPPFDPREIEYVLNQIKAASSISDEQLHAVRAALTHPLSILTGGPGTGKTTTIRAIIDAVRTLIADAGNTPKVLLMAPTGKAADRMQESTGMPAGTIHMALKYDPEENGFTHGADHPWDADLIICDEYSMVDCFLATNQFKAISNTRFVIVGDVYQLPSVDAGRVLQDIIEAQICPVTRLTVVHRTGAGSAIAVGADRINRGLLPAFGKPGQSDLVFIEMDDLDKAADRVVKMVAETLPRYTGQACSTIQVLSPGKNSAIGVKALNHSLQKALNPNLPITPSTSESPRLAIRNDHRPRLGDRVICMKTSYELGVFNGDVGVITACDFDDKDRPSLLVDFGKKAAVLPRGYWDNLDLAYALTIHKSQGSEYDIVIIPITTSHYTMLKRNLLYTGVTRAKKMCVVVGSRRALQRAIATIDGSTRQTGLLCRIRELQSAQNIQNGVLQ